MSRKFGVEIEAYNVNRYTLAQALTEAGVPCEVQGYNHHDLVGLWKIVNDCSVHGQNTFELVSPILEGEEGLAQVRLACSVLKTLGAKVNRTCGLHVHHDARDLDLKAWKMLLGLYVNYESAIDALMPLSRRGSTNYFCQSMRRWGNINETADTIMACQSIEQLAQLFACRYIKVNFYAFWQHGTIEFRHHSGTVDADKILNWVRLTGLMIDKAVSAKHVLIRENDDLVSKFRSLMITLHTSGAMKRFYSKRFAAMQQPATAAEEG